MGAEHRLVLLLAPHLLSIARVCEETRLFPCRQVGGGNWVRSRVRGDDSNDNVDNVEEVDDIEMIDDGEELTTTNVKTRVAEREGRGENIMQETTRKKKMRMMTFFITLTNICHGQLHK